MWINYCGDLKEVKIELENVEKSEEEKLSLANSQKLELEEVEEEINGLMDRVGSLKDKWFIEERKLSFFAEHNELEKISYAITVLEENAKNNEYNDALVNIVEANYWLEHIKEKDSFKLKNIF